MRDQPGLTATSDSELPVPSWRQRLNYDLENQTVVAGKQRFTSTETASVTGSRRFRTLASLLLGVTWVAQGQFRSADPASAGMSAQRLSNAIHLLETETSSGRVLAASLLVARDQRIGLHKGFGRLAPAPDARATMPDTIFLLASITKPVTACALMLLVERGLVSLDDPVSHYLPEFKGEDRKNTRVRDLLAHTSGLPDMLPENTELRRAHAPLSEFVRRAMTTRLLFPPRTDFRYQSMGILLAAEIVERVSGKRLRDFLKQEIFDPLGMRRSALGMGAFTIQDTAWCQTSPGSSAADLERFGANSPYWRDMGHPWAACTPRLLTSPSCSRLSSTAVPTAVTACSAPPL